MNNPAYQEIVKEGTGHKQAIEIEFDPLKVTINTLLFKFLRSVDVTAVSGQCCDRVRLYKTAISRTDQAHE